MTHNIILHLHCRRLLCGHFSLLVVLRQHAHALRLVMLHDHLVARELLLALS